VTYTLAFIIVAIGLFGFCRSRYRVAFAAVVLAGQGGMVALSLGYPAPWWLERGCMVEPTVLASMSMEDEGRILVWLHSPECGDPVAYAFPWSARMAGDLAEAQGEAADRGSSVRAKRLFERTYDQGPPQFYAAPQAALPPKSTPPAPAIVEQDT
jgi:hypothetical protein